jgi:deazaflavin-dependent oxidoreductase (nitroreductase family)
MIEHRHFALHDRATLLHAELCDRLNRMKGPVTSLNRRILRIGNRIGVWLYRVSAGRLSSGSKDVRVLMITTPGRRTGIPRSTCMRYFDTADGFVVWGTGSGSKQDPDWFRNLRKSSVADVQIGARKLQCQPRELVGSERDAVWRDLVLARAPEVEKYARKAGRTIPVAVLVPLQA